MPRCVYLWFLTFSLRTSYVFRRPSPRLVVISALDNVAAVAVFGEANALMGQVVCARVETVDAEDRKLLYRRIRAACKAALENYKVPSKVEIADERRS